ncbi:MAG: hypothetical protein HN337_04320 [Deltaproteobacteria bacterium]|jgi:3',5'-cyclic AMP phosphodiesterase CpdA|nr:hypothetical protein [Deltaproteobacteria bacterium]
MYKRMYMVFILMVAAVFVGGISSASSGDMNTALKRLASENGSFEFAVIGDNRSGDGVYSKITKQIRIRKPLFVMNTGDIIPTPGNRHQWQNFWRLSKEVPRPYFLVPGNHDINNVASQEVWRDEVDLPGNETYYSFTVGKNLFVVLNSCDPRYDRMIAGEQLAWLNRTLNPKKYEHQFVFLHHPLYLWKGASHYGMSLDRYPKARNRLHNLLSRKKVNVVFMGHEHTFKKQGKIDGVEYIVTGGAGAPLYSGFNNVVFVNVDGDIIKAKTVDRNGYLRDEFYIKGP